VQRYSLISNLPRLLQEKMKLFSCIFFKPLGSNVLMSEKSGDGKVQLLLVEVGFEW
jgi:hypothetical protein